MKMKPVILILTSSDISEQIPSTLKDSIEKVGTHYAVVFDETQYDSKLKFKSAYNLRWIKQKYSKKKKDDENAENEKEKENVNKHNRVRNAVLRFKPTCIVCLSSHAQSVALDAKRKTGFETPIVAIMPTFTADKNFFELATDAFIVENEDVKAEVVKIGIPARSIVALGLPFAAKNVNEEERMQLRHDLGISKAKTVFLNCRDKKDCAEMFDMLLDQGDIINVIAYCPKAETFSELRKLVELKSSDNVQLFDKKSNFDEYLTASDIVITYYNPSTIFKSFTLGRAVITFPAKTELAKKDLGYLAENNLIYAAKDSKDIIIGLYKLLQTDLAEQMLNSANERQIENNVELIAEYLMNFGKDKDEEDDEEQEKQIELVSVIEE